MAVADGCQQSFELPLHLWSRVFAKLRPVSTAVTDACLSGKNEDEIVSKLLTDQACYLRLKLVSKKFQQVFSDNPELADDPVVTATNAMEFAPKMLLRLQQPRHLKCFTAVDQGSYLNITPSASPELVKLRHVYCTDPSANALYGPSVFSSLVRCDLRRRQQHLQPIDLQLQACFQLECLLCGLYTNFQAPGSLTKLCVRSSCLQVAQVPVGLQNLTVFGSSLIGLAEGLLACICLTGLDLEGCTFDADTESKCLCIGPGVAAVLIPEQLSKLNALTMLTLRLECSNDSNLVLDISWIYSLTSLRCLNLSVDGIFEITNELTQLQHVTKLQMKAGSSYAEWHATCLVDWELMQCLQCLDLSGPISFDARMLQLTALCCLNEVGLCSDCLLNGSSGRLFGFVFDLATAFPHILVKLDGSLC